MDREFADAVDLGVNYWRKRFKLLPAAYGCEYVSAVVAIYNSASCWKQESIKC